MNTETHAEVEYCARVEELYEAIQQWLPGDVFEFQREKTWLNEEGIGEYFADKLILKDKDQGIIATLVPIAATVIDGEGRLDIQGKYGVETLLWLRHDAPTFTILRNGRPVETKQFFDHVDADGWHWIENTRPGMAELLSSELLRSLLLRASDYEFA